MRDDVGMRGFPERTARRFLAREDQKNSPTADDLIVFLDDEVPGWREMTPDELRAQLGVLMDETLDTYNQLNQLWEQS